MKLYYYPICPVSNKFRILFKLINFNYEGIKIISKQNIQQLDKFNFKFLPILEDNNGDCFRDSFSILMHLYKCNDNKLIIDWFKNENIQYMEMFFDKHMFFDVFKNSIFEKTEKLVIYNEYFPNMELIKRGNLLQDSYLIELNQMLNNYNWIGGKELTINDISAFTMLASMDYCFMVSWDKYQNLKQWYRRMKSNNDYNFILNDRVYNLLPPSHYENPDF